MKAAVLYKPHDLRIEDVDTPKIGKQEVLVEVKACGICKYDVRLFKGISSITYPIVLGHEIAGIIVKTGEEVKSLNPGDKVVVDLARRCGNCFYCLRNQQDLCLKYASYGGLAECISTTVKNIYLFRNVDFDIASFAEPIACCLNSLSKVKVEPASDAVVIGDGPIGLIFMQLLYQMGVSRVIVIGHHEERLSLARRFGVYETINSLHEELVSSITKVFEGALADVVIIAADNASAFAKSLGMVNKGGTIIFFSGLHPETFIPISSHFLHYSQVKLIGSSGCAPYTLSEAVKLLEYRSLGLNYLVTHKFPIEETVQAIKAKDNRVSMRPIVDPSSDKGQFVEPFSHNH